MAKAFSMVGEFEFAKLAGAGDNTLATPMTAEEALDAISTGLAGIEMKDNLPYDFIDSNAIKQQYVDGKGRGLIAAKDICKDKLLIIDRSIKFQWELLKKNFQTSLLVRNFVAICSIQLNTMDY